MTDNWKVEQGDCRDIMRTLPDNSVDAIVSDPPYGLSFMGKAWDHGVPGVEFWTDALRVAKPGAHLVAFGGTRTYHRLAVAIEDAGWDVRDCLSWLYGSGFPKSLAVDKAIDKMDAAEEQMARRYRFTAWVREVGLTSKQIDEATSTNMGGHYTTAASQPAIMTLEHLNAVRHLIGEVPEWVERECAIRSVESKNFAKREVVGQKDSNLLAVAPGQDNDRSATTLDITAPATDAAKRWHGWGTALKPAWEPIILARKPLTGTVAANVTQYGTGAINVDGSRIGERWPANVLLDEEAAGLLGEQSRFFFTAQGDKCENVNIAGQDLSQPSQRDGFAPAPASLLHSRERCQRGRDCTADCTDCIQRQNLALSAVAMGNTDTTQTMQTYCESCGSALPAIDAFTNQASAEKVADANDPVSGTRFLYTSKVSRKEREAGLDGMPNAHPTLKPIALMRWLCRLVTPPGGLILDPFNGSGSTGCAAVLEGFRYVGCELEAEYVEIARRRIAYWEGQRKDPDLFG